VSGALRDRSVRTRRPSPPWANDSARSAASARARGRVADLDRDRDSVRRSFDTKVIGRLMLAKHLAPRMTTAASFVIFSGGAAAKIVIGTLGVAITNGAADVLARSLALELAPIRVNAVSPGVIDTGAWTSSASGASGTSPTSVPATRPVASGPSTTSRPASCSP
jgi:NAD(P)-dependent dehydrogenase (short-subunit alcohol dehydrogenase family)